MREALARVRTRAIAIMPPRDFPNVVAAMFPEPGGVMIGLIKYKGAAP